MKAYALYITEPAVIDSDLVATAFGQTSHTIVAGSTDFTVGDAASCDTVLIRSATHIDSTIKEKMPHLQRIVRVGVGLDNVDLDYCDQAGITVYNAPGANADAVAEYAVTVILLALRKLHLLTPADQANWNRHKFTGRSITSCSIGIVGYGNIGKLLHGKLRGLGCTNFVLYDPFISTPPEGARLATLDELLQTSDIVSLHLPLLPQTTHIINAEKLALLKPDAILLNAARGGIVDEAAVFACPPTQVFTYIADTVEGEPYPNPALLKDPRIIVTPHVASLTTDAEAAMVRVAIEHLLADTPAVRVPKK
jgi:phosphoglycerate dehydrogenase-like enzyme